jgi:major membrane immunogen (membrane-anchored lipoprotein)
MMRLLGLTIAVAALSGLSACGDKPQTLGSGVKTDGAAYQGVQNQFAAPGWKAGDKTSWEQSLKARAQNSQNEYNKVGSSK